MTRRGRGRHDGYILVTVLAIAVMLTGLLAAGSLVARSGLGTARVDETDVAAAGLVSSGVEIAAYQLTVLRIRPELVDGHRIHLAGGTVTPYVTVEAGKVDVNAADPKLLVGIMQGVGMDQATASDVVDRIVALRGPTNGTIPDAGGRTPGAPPSPGGNPFGFAASSNGAGQANGATGGQAGAQAGGQTAGNVPGVANAPPKRRGLQSIEDLRDIDGVTAEDMRLLRRRLTIYNTDGRLDIMSASPDTLSSVPGMTKLKLTQVLAARESGSPEATREAQSALGGDMASFTKVLPGPAYTIRIDADETNGRKRTAEAVIAASKSPNQPYYILDWRE